MKTHSTTMGFVLGMFAAVLMLPMAEAMDSRQDVLVVPARFRIVQFAFDVAALRDAALVSYDDVSEGEDVILHVWNAKGRSWQRISADEFSFGSFTKRKIGNMYLLSSGPELPAVVLTGASQAGQVSHIDSLNLMTVANSLNKSMKFKSREWKLLSERHGLQIKDLNYERRRWGRYGPPDKIKQNRPKPSVEDEGDELEFEQDQEDVPPTPLPEMPVIEEKGAPVPQPDVSEVEVEEAPMPEETIEQVAEPEPLPEDK